MKKHLFNNIIPVTAICLLCIFSFFHSMYANGLSKYTKATINKSKVILEIADTDEKRQQGLMSRDHLKKNHGMLFVFDEPRQVYFWMKNVKIPLDILFIYKNKIVKIYSMLPVCTQENCQIYPSEYKVDYAIELNGGFCRKNNVKVGQNIKPGG